MSKAKLGEDVWKNRIEKVNAELFVLTYGSLVAQLVRDCESYQQVNAELDKMYVHSHAYEFLILGVTIWA